MKTFLKVILTITLAAAAESCAKYDTPLVKTPLSVDGKILSFDAEGGQQLVQGYKNEGSISVDAITLDGVTIKDDGNSKTPLEGAWFCVSNDQYSNGIIITVLNNDTGKGRTGTVYCHNSEARFGTITVRQKE